MPDIEDDFSTQVRRKGEFDPRTVEKLHATSDVDSDVLAQHHTLGVTHNQAAFGDHDHDGTNSSLLMTGITVTGSKGGNAALADLITKLSAALGFTDSTT